MSGSFEGADPRSSGAFTSSCKSTTLPMVIFSKVKLGVSPDINALATIIIVTVSIGVAIAWLVGRRVAKPD